MNTKLKKLLLGWLGHYGALTATLNVFYLFKYLDQSPSQGKTPWEFFVYHTFQDIDALITLISLLLIEINYQYLFKKLRIYFFLGSCLVVGLFAYLTVTIFHYDKYSDQHLPFESLLIVAAYALTYAIIRNYLYQIRYAKDLKLQQSKNELDTLKAQINPHFLFNILNYLYGTALNEKASSTADGIDKLSQMMRYSITGIHENFVPIEKEFEFIHHYLALQQARLPKRENINIDINFPSSLPDCQIAPLLILPFIENAFKYGISMDERCFVSIKIEIVGHTLTTEISNSIVSGPIEIRGNNTGIKNTIKRLALLYPGRHILKQTNDGHTYQTLLNLTLPV